MANYPEFVWERLLEKFAGGESIEKICEDPEMPEPETVFQKKFVDEVFLGKYIIAERMHASAKIAEVFEIADDRNSDARCRAVRVNTRIKVAERLIPRYSTRVTHQTEDAEGKKPLGAIVVPLRQMKVDEEDDDTDGSED